MDDYGDDDEEEEEQDEEDATDDDNQEGGNSDHADRAKFNPTLRPEGPACDPKAAAAEPLSELTPEPAAVACAK